MRTSFTLALAAAAAGVLAQDDQSLCDKYTTALLTDNTGANQYALLNLLVNRVVIGNFSANDADINVPGILAPATFMNEEVALLKYFDGSLASSNRGNQATAVNFLDGGAAEPLMMDPPMPANSEDTAQYRLLTALYSFFGSLLQCSQVGQDGFPAYQGSNSMEEVHRFMALSPAENGYFITQVGLAAASFGVTEEDVTAVGTALTNLFNFRCSPPTQVTGDEPELQAICQAEECPLSPEATCEAYPNGGVVTEPSPVSSGMPSGSGTPMPTGSATPTGSAPGETFTGAASHIAVGAGAGLSGLVAFLFAL